MKRRVGGFVNGALGDKRKTKEGRKEGKKQERRKEGSGEVRNNG
jgi:hypothetical protein